MTLLPGRRAEDLNDLTLNLIFLNVFLRGWVRIRSKPFLNNLVLQPCLVPKNPTSGLQPERMHP